MTARKPRQSKKDVVQLVTKEDRIRLAVRKAPYYLSLEPGLSLGIFKGTLGSVWRVRLTKPRQQDSLGAPEEEEGRTTLQILSFEDAVTKAKRWGRDLLAKAAKPAPGTPVAQAANAIPADPTVEDALRAYLAHLEMHQVEAFGTSRTRIEKIIREIGHLKIRTLTPKDLTDWQAFIVNSPPQRRPHRDGSPNFAKDFDPTNPKHKLKRQSTANRCLGDIKAALNQAYANQWVVSDQGWRGVDAFEDCSGRREEVLDAGQQSDFLNSCCPEFRPLAFGALLTGNRYGPMTKWKVKAFRPLERAIQVGWDKKHQRERLAPLTDEAVAVFYHICRGRDPEEPLFLKADGKPWGRNHQARPMSESAEAMDLDVCFYNLRHTAITMWLLSGVDVAIVASAVGTSVAMIERHYKNPRVGHLAGLLNQKVPQIGCYSQEVEAITQMFDQQRLERLQARKQLHFSLESLHPTAYAGKILGGTEDPLPAKPRPTREELEALLETTPMLKIGELYGVSGNTIKTWAQKAGLPAPQRGSWAKRQHEARLEGAQPSPAAPAQAPKPTRKELEALLARMPATQIAKRFGVVAPTVLRWAAQWGIPRPGRGTWAKRAGEAYRRLKAEKRAARRRGEQP